MGCLKKADPAPVVPQDTAVQQPETWHPVAPCQPEEAAFRGVGLGYPRSADRLDTLGTVRTTVLFADFPDAAATRSTGEIMDILLPTAASFAHDVSYGKMSLALDAHPVWLRMSKPSSSYAQDIRTFEGHRDWLQEAMDLADDAVDFSDTALVLVMATPNASQIAYGPTWTGYSGAGGTLTADGAQITNGITSGADLLHWGGLWLNHEMGHSMSLVDLYNYEGGSGFSAPFSMMDVISSSAPEYLAYERWFLGWIEDSQIYCLPSSATVTLTAIEQDGGYKAAMVPLDDNRVLVVESRRALGWDAALPRGGVIVYTVDTTVASGYGTIVVGNERTALAPQESLTVSGITVTVVKATEDTDRVTIAVPAG
jgi:M6 family metalloprotease-like protein